MHYQNPVIPGFNPDPSLCRVGEDFYLVTSSFEFFPGVPIYHSRNLVNWELIGHCLTDETQLPLKKCRASGGIWAPTLRCHQGRFYMTTTNSMDGGNFYVTAESIHGPWSAPVWVEMEGIDPTIFFDEDGSSWYLTNGGIDGESGLILAPIDLATGKLLTAPRLICRGSGGRALEAPHLYKIHDTYYLLAAEGGTEEGHMVTIFRSNQIEGPYEGCPRNPILTHRDRLWDPIQATGHADLVEDQNGNWWAVCLAIQTIGGMHLHNLGRETYLAPVSWVDGWPVIGNEGTVSYGMDGPLPSPATPACHDFFDAFESPAFHKEWNWVRNLDKSSYLIKDGALTLKHHQIPLSAPTGSPCFMGIRQTGFISTFEATVMPGEHSFGGLTAYLCDTNHYDVFARRNGDRLTVGLRKCLLDIETITCELEQAAEGPVWLRIVTGPQRYDFFASIDGVTWMPLGSGMTAGLCTEVTPRMTFTGVYLGLWCDEGGMQFRSVKKQDSPRSPLLP